MNACASIFAWSSKIIFLLFYVDARVRNINSGVHVHFACILAMKKTLYPFHNNIIFNRIQSSSSTVGYNTYRALQARATLKYHTYLPASFFHSRKKYNILVSVKNRCQTDRVCSRIKQHPETKQKLGLENLINFPNHNSVCFARHKFNSL